MAAFGIVRRLLGLLVVISALLSFISPFEVQAHIIEQHLDVNVTPLPGGQREPSIAVNPSNANQLLVAAMNDGGLVGYSGSTNGGATWGIFNTFTVSTYDESWDPSAVFDASGNSYILVIANMADSGSIKKELFLAKSNPDGSFTSTTLGGLTGLRFIDKPWMAVDTTRSPNRIIITWLESNSPCPLCMSVKVGYTDDALTLSGIQTLWTYSSTDGAGVWPFVATDNRDPLHPHVYVSWLVDTSNPHPSSLFCVAQSTSCNILTKRSDDHGANWQTNPVVAATTGPMCSPLAEVHPVQSLAVDDSVSNVYAAWHDCREDPPGSGSFDSDIWFSRSTDLGVTWSNTIKVNDESGTPNRQQFWPAMTTKGGEIYIAFYDTRFNLNNPDVFFAESSDHGGSFQANLRVTDASSPWIDQGDYIGITAATDAVHPIWTDARTGTQIVDIYTDKMTPDSGGIGGSVAHGTLITKADGSKVPVQNLLVGDSILTYDVYTGLSVPGTIASIRETFVNNQLILFTQDGLPLRVDANPRLKFYTLTSNEPVLKPITKFQPGDLIYSYDAGRWATVTQVNIIYGGSHEFYDLLTDPYLNPDGQYLNFIANGYADPCQIPCKQGPNP